MEELIELEEIQDIEINDLDYIDEELIQTTLNYNEQGLYNLEIEALNVLVVQNYVIISLLLIFILLKRKWVEL